MYRHFQRVHKIAGPLSSRYLLRGFTTLRTTRTPAFFHRERELGAFQDVFLSEPRLSVVTGGPSVGKSVLLDRVLDEPPFDLVKFDLRDYAFLTWQGT